MNAELALARVEGRRLLRNPLVWLGVIPSAAWANETKTSTEFLAQDTWQLLTGYVVLLPGFVAVVALMLSVLRSRSAHADGLLDTMPVGQAQRSVAHGCSTAAAALFGAVVIAATFIYLRPPALMGVFDDNSTPQLLHTPRPNLAQLLQGPVAVAAVAAGVITLVRWVPTWLVAIPLFFLMYVQGLIFGIFNGMSTSWLTWVWPLSTGVVHDGYTGGCGGDDAGGCQLVLTGFDQVTPWWHLAYLLALGVWFVTVAVLRHRRDRGAWIAFAVSLAVTAGLAVVQAAVHVQPVYTQ